MAAGVVLGLFLAASPAAGQDLRIVSLNASNSGSATASPREGMQLILQSIGAATSDDPTLPGNSGIARPIDILCLQEAHRSATTAAAYASLLNQIYGATHYAAGTLDGATTGAGTQVVVFNTRTVALMEMAAVGTVSTAGAPRQALRYRFRPRGYIADAGDLFVYNAHFKAGNTATDRSRRLVEAHDIRADADALGPARNVVYLGDLNLYTSQEPAYQRLLETGTAGGFDPIDRPGAWSDDAAFAAVHTQSPWDPALASTTGFNGSGGGMDDRFDFQLVSAAIRSGESGLLYAFNSYYAFGNNGTHLPNGAINTGTAVDPQVLTALAGILDHLPVVTDYRLRPRLGLALGGDANLDGIANLADFAVLATNFNGAADWFGGDFTGDGRVGVEDFSLLASNLNQTGGAGAVAGVVPEPAGIAAVGAALFLFRRRAG